MTEATLSPDAPVHERLAHSSELHQRTVQWLVELIREGEGHIRKRESAWRDVDQALRLYVDLSKPAKTADGGEIAGKAEQPFRRSFMLPITYANVMSRMAMKFGELTARDPLIHLDPVDSDDYDAARLHEAALRYSLQKSRGNLVLWQLLYDQERYGFTMCYDTWAETYDWKEMPGVFPQELAAALPWGMQELAAPHRVWGVTEQWVRWQPIDPYRAIVDGSQPLWEPQRWRFAGHWGSENWLYLHERRLAQNEGPYFNIDEARRVAAAGTGASDSSGRSTAGSFTETAELEGTYPNLKLTHLQVKLIPRERGLSGSERPEIWWFSLVNDELIVRAHPSVYRAGQYTYSTAIADLDQHAPFTAGLAEQIDGIQRLVNYLVFSHVENTRKTLNDAMVFDPSLLESKDLYQPGPGRFVRLTRQGQKLLQRGIIPIGGMFSQIGTADVTAQHLATAGQFIEFAQLLSGASSPAQGQLFSHKRTLGEVEKAVAGSTQRVGVDLHLFDEQMLATLTPRALVALQQWLTIEQAVLVSSQQAQAMGRRRLTLRPGELRGTFNYIPRTPTMAADPSRTAAVWGGMLQVLASAPQLLEPYNGKRLNPHEVFGEFAKANGVHYLERFYTPALPPAMGAPGPGRPSFQVVPDELAMRAAAAGNALPATLPRAV